MSGVDGHTPGTGARGTVPVTERRDTRSGVLVVENPVGPTSHDVVALVRRLAGIRRGGHGGTLDPFASGVLPVFLGAATRMVEYHLGDPKAYRALVCFGARSTTDDIDGELVPGPAPSPDRSAVEAALPVFRGRILQRPPDYSAVKIGGRRAYEMARRGEHPEPHERTVEIMRLDLLEWDATDASRPSAVVQVACSAGTYIRAIARDLGEALGCGAYLGSLVRTASGPFRLEDAVPLDVLRGELAADALELRLLPPDVGLDDYPIVAIDANDVAALVRGQVVARPTTGVPVLPGPGGVVRVVDEAGTLVAMAKLVANRLHPDKVLQPPVPSRVEGEP
jgi:tRNA pseudouridine55 synthase